jgi:hypothetical protein
MAGRHEDVADPYGSSIEHYVRTADLLDELIDAGLPSVLQRIGIAAQHED